MRSVLGWIQKNAPPITRARNVWAGSPIPLGQPAASAFNALKENMGLHADFSRGTFGGKMGVRAKMGVHARTVVCSTWGELMASSAASIGSRSGQGSSAPTLARCDHLLIGKLASSSPAACGDLRSTGNYLPVPCEAEAGSRRDARPQLSTPVRGRR